MNIGFVIEQLAPQRGGAEQWSWQFIQQLLTHRHEVHVLSSYFAPEVKCAGIVPHLIPTSHRRLEFAVAAEEKLRELRLDVVHDTGCGWRCDVFQPHGGSRLAAIESNLEMQTPWFKPFKRQANRLLPRYRTFRKLLERQYALDGRVFLALSRRVADDMQRLHGIPSEAIRVVYNGVDTGRFSPVHAVQHREAVRHAWDVADEELLVLIVAHNFRLKGVPQLIRAGGRLRNAGLPVHVMVAGNGRDRRCEWLARRHGAKVTFTGPVADPVPLYAAADLYVQPTFYDPCSLVVLEALASGLPVITTRANGAGELIAQDVEGTLLDDPRDTQSLAAAIERLSPLDIRLRMGRAARILALEHTLEQNCLEILDVYDEIHGRAKKLAA